MNAFAYCFALSALVCCSFSAHLPANFKTCKRSDPNYKTCMMSAVQGALVALKDGNKELGVNPLEPLEIAKIHAPGTGTSVKIDQLYTNLKLYGLSSSIIKDFSLDLDKCIITAEGVTPVLNIIGDYDFKGRLILIPIDSKGLHNNTFINLSSSLRLQCEKFDKKGKEYLRIKDFTIKIGAEKVIFSYDKVFEADKAIGEEISNILNDNSQAIFDDSKADWELAYGIIFKDIANKIFTRIPLKEIFLD